MGGANGSRECAPDDKLRDTHQLHLMEMMGFAGSTHPTYWLISASLGLIVIDADDDDFVGHRPSQSIAAMTNSP
jgi:hypothetical protein